MWHVVQELGYRNLEKDRYCQSKIRILKISANKTSDYQTYYLRYLRPL
jgi:hypothetical protein